MGVAPAELWEPTLAVLAAASKQGDVLGTGLEQICELVDADRADAGFVRSPTDTYQPSVLVARGATRTATFAIPAADPIVNAVLATDHTVGVFDTATDMPDGPCRSAMLNVGTRTVVVRRLEMDGTVFGLVCIDWTNEPRQVDHQAVELIDIFVASVLTPVLALTDQTGPCPPRRSGALSGAEMDAVRLAARGLSYADIARQLGKSISTIDHQLLRARRRLGAKNTAQLSQMLALELNAVEADAARPEAPDGDIHR